MSDDEGGRRCRCGGSDCRQSSRLLSCLLDDWTQGLGSWKDDCLAFVIWCLIDCECVMQVVQEGIKKKSVIGQVDWVRVGLRCDWLVLIRIPVSMRQAEAKKQSAKEGQDRTNYGGGEEEKGCRRGAKLSADGDWLYTQVRPGDGLCSCNSETLFFFFLFLGFLLV